MGSGYCGIESSFLYIMCNLKICHYLELLSATCWLSEPLVVRIVSKEATTTQANEISSNSILLLTKVTKLNLAYFLCS